jgi:pSer/pThr/pTyr-binding forkhead associated (FHA) protein
MALSVVIRSGEVEASPTITFDTPRVVLGRGEGCDVRLPDPTISHRHASLRQRGTDYIVVDEASTNGTFVGPVRLPPHTPRIVRNGDLIRLGRIWLELRIEQVAPTRQPHLATREVALGLVAAALAAEGENAALTVRVVTGPDAGKTLRMTDFDHPYVLGRGGGGGRGDGLAFDDPDVSRRHVELVRRGDKLLARELGSKNGAILDGSPLTPDRPTPWKRGTTLSVGACELAYDDPVADALAELERAADERMGDDESVEPPPGVEISGASPRTTSPIAAQGDAPVVAVPRRRTGRPGPGRRGWSATDYLVALLALAVLTLSILGLMWLLGSD